MSKARGIVCTCIIQKPHEEPPHEPTQSAQSGSCSAPMVRVPPLGTGALLLLLLLLPLLELLLPEAAELFDFLSLPHAAASRPMQNTSARSLKPRRCRVTKWTSWLGCT